MIQGQPRTAETHLGPVPGWRPRADDQTPSAPSRPAAALPDALEGLGTRRMVGRGQEIYAAGDPAGYCYRVVSGCVRLVGLDEDGRRQIADFLLPGDLLGLDALGAHHLSAEAVADAVLLCCPRRALEALAERDGALARRLRDLTSQSLRRAHEKLFLLGRKTAGERVGAFLFEMASRAPAGGAGGHFQLPITRADIADHLGLTIETVSRSMARLCRDGTIAATKSGVQIRDRRALGAFGACITRH